MTKLFLKVLNTENTKTTGSTISSSNLPIIAHLGQVEKKNFTWRPKSVVSSTSFGGGRKLGKIKLISSYKTRRALQSRDSEINFEPRGPKQLTGISFDNNSKKM